jgi:hypothetical protein
MTRLLLALAFACVTAPAWAEETVKAVGATGDTVVVFPWGAWILALSNAFLEAAAPVIVSFIVGFIATKYPLLKSFISEKLVEDQVGKFVSYAENATAGSIKGAHLDVNVGQSVLGTAVARGMESANVNLLARKAVKWAGGPEGIAKKVFRRLNLNETASAETVLVPVLRKIEDGTLLPEKIATLKIVPHEPTKVVPKVTPKAPAAPAAPLHRPVPVPPAHH